jgi:RNA polymerase sigma-70 factor (ECF subfamily)
MSGISEAEFENVFSQWYEPVRNFLYYKSGDIQVAEDIVQDVFMKVWEKKEGIRLETVKSLLYKIANNLFLNRLEHQKVLLKFIPANPVNIEIAGPDFELEMKEFDKKLQSALSGLDEKQRTVFLMNRVDGLTYVQIAEILGLSVKGIEKRMEKALAFLKKRIAYHI